MSNIVPLVPAVTEEELEHLLRVRYCGRNPALSRKENAVLSEAQQAFWYRGVWGDRQALTETRQRLAETGLLGRLRALYGTSRKT